MKIQKSRKGLFTGIVTASIAVVGVISGVGVLKGNDNTYAMPAAVPPAGSFTISPSSAPLNGGTRVTVTYDGTDPTVRFLNGASSNLGGPIELGGFGGPPCFDVEIVSDLELKCTTSAVAALSKQWPPNFVIYAIGYTGGTAVSTGSTVLTYTDTVYAKESSGNLEYFVNKFTGDIPVVTLDGVEVNSANYSYELMIAAENIYKLTLSSAYLNTLGDGEYDLHMLYNGQDPQYVSPYKFTILPSGGTAESASYTKGSDSHLAHRFEKTFDPAVEVKVNGAVLDSAHYTVTEGSTIITLLSSYLDSLTAGSHILVANFTDGSSFARQFYVMDANLMNPGAAGLAGSNELVPGVPSTGLF